MSDLNQGTTVTRCPRCGARGVLRDDQRRLGGAFCYCLTNKGDPIRMEEAEVVELSRLRAAEEELQEAVTDLASLAVSNNQLRVERDRLAEALREIVDPLPAVFPQRQMEVAREALASLEQKEEPGG